MTHNLRSVSEVVDSLEPIWTEADQYETDAGYSPLIPSRTLAVNVLTTDRAHIATVLIAGLEGSKESTRDCGRCNNCESAVSECESIIYYNGLNQGIELAQALIKATLTPDPK